MGRQARGDAAAALRATRQLTVEFLEGERARYIAPLRLYLVREPRVLRALGGRAGVARAGERSRRSGASATQDVTIGVGSHTIQTELTADQREVILASVGPRSEAPPSRSCDDSAADPAGVSKGFHGRVMPKRCSLLLPVFARESRRCSIRTRRFAEHLYFALHVHAFGFVALSLSVLSPLHALVRSDRRAGVLPFVWAPIYWPRALRRVYGGSLGAHAGQGDRDRRALRRRVHPQRGSFAVWMSES